MDRRLKLSLAALPAAAAAAACGWYFMPRAGEPVAMAPPAVVEHCRRAAELLYEVHWAAACYKTNADNDCMLPDSQAARVNAILAAEETRCMASETQAMATR